MLRLSIFGVHDFKYFQNDINYWRVISYIKKTTSLVVSTNTLNTIFAILFVNI